MAQGACYVSAMSLTDPTVFVPLLTLATAFLAEGSSTRPTLVQLTDMDGEPILLRPSDVFAIYPSRVRVGGCDGSALRVLGLKRVVNVREPIDLIAQRMGGNWARVHVPGSYLDLGVSTVEVLVDPTQVIAVEPGTTRVGSRTLTVMQLAEGFNLRVFEDAHALSRLLSI